MTDLRDRARDEADLRQRLSDLAATITTDTTWTSLQTHIATTPAPRPPRRLLSPTRVRIAAAAAAVVVLAAAALLVARHGDDDRVRTADTTTTTSSSTTTTRPGETTTLPPPATNIPGTPSPVARADQTPLIDLPLVEDVLGFGSGGGLTDTGQPVPISPSPTAPTTTTTTGPTILPTGPDGNPMIHYPADPNWDPILTYHQEGQTDVIDVWVNLGPGGVQHLDHIEIPPRPGQNCLILGSTTTPLFDVPMGGDPMRIIGGVVTTQAPVLFMTNIPPSVGAPVDDLGFPISSIEAFPGLRLVMLLVPGDFVKLDAKDANGVLHHTVTAADPDAFPDTC